MIDKTFIYAKCNVRKVRTGVRIKIEQAGMNYFSEICITPAVGNFDWQAARGLTEWTLKIPFVRLTKLRMVFEIPEVKEKKEKIIL